MTDKAQAHLCVCVYKVNTHSCWAPACLPGRLTGKMKSRVKQEKSKKIVVSFFVYVQVSGLWQPGGPASPLRLSLHLFCCARTAAVAAMLGCVLCALFEPAWQSASSPSASNAGPVALVHEREQWVEVPHQDSLEVVLLSEGCTNWALRHGGDHEKELWIHIDYQFLPSVPSLPPPALIPRLPPSFTSSQHLWWPSASSHHQSHSFSSFFYPSMHPSFPPSLSPPSLSSMQL